MPAIVVDAVVGGQHKWTLERPGRRSHAGAWKRSPSESATTKRWGAGPARRMVRGMTGLRGRKQPFGAEPGAGCGTGNKGQACLRQRVFAPPVPAARRPGSFSGRAALAVVWRRPHGLLWAGKEKSLPARGRGHPGDAGASRQRSPRWSVEINPWRPAPTDNTRPIHPCEGAGVAHHHHGMLLLLHYRPGGRAAGVETGHVREKRGNDHKTIRRTRGSDVGEE